MRIKSQFKVQETSSIHFIYFVMLHRCSAYYSLFHMIPFLCYLHGIIPVVLDVAAWDYQVPL